MHHPKRAEVKKVLTELFETHIELGALHGVQAA